MSQAAFPIDPGDMPALKRWLASQDDPQVVLRPVDIDEIIIGSDALLELPPVLRRAGMPAGAPVLVVADETPISREGQDLKPLVQALLKDAGYQVRMLWLKGDAYGLVHADDEQVERVRTALAPGMALVAVGSGTVTDIAKHASYLYDQQRPQQPQRLHLLPDCQFRHGLRGEHGGAAERWRQAHGALALSNGNPRRPAHACQRSSRDERGGSR